MAAATSTAQAETRCRDDKGTAVTQIIKTTEAGWQNAVSDAMKNGEEFELVTLDPDWQPDSNNPLNVAKWMWGSTMPEWVAKLLGSRGIELDEHTYVADASVPKGVPLDSAEKVAIVGASGMILVGCGMILLAFFDAEPTSKLGLLVGGGVVTVLSGGGIFAFILIKRGEYEWEQEVCVKSGKAVWKARPQDRS